MARDYHEARRARLPLAKALFVLGISLKWIADAVGITIKTLTNDLESIGLTKSGEKQGSKQVYTSVFKRYAEISSQTNPSGEDALIFPHLVNYLRIPYVMNVIIGLGLAMQRLAEPEYPAEIEHYARLVRTICNCGGSISIVDYTPTSFWKEYVRGVINGTIAVPTSHQDLMSTLSKRYVKLNRDIIMPIWPDNVVKTVDKILATLTPNEEKIIRARFGIGMKQQTVDQVRQGFEDASRDRILQIEARALRKLRHPSRAKHLTGLTEPLKPKFYVPEAPVEPLPEVVDPNLPMKHLVKSVKELQFSVRTENCMDHGNIQRVWELAEKTEAELLRVKNFGRKSLKEVKEILAEMNLTLGMKFNDATKKAMLDYALKPKEVSV